MLCLPTCFLQVIPNKFIDHFGGNISRTIELESRNGSMYTVEVSKLMNETVLRRRGWQAFVDAHGVEENDSLLFRHIEKSCFEVLVLDSDDCEKVLPSAGIKVASCNAQESGSVDYIDISSSVGYIDISSSSGDDTTRSPGSQRFATCERGDSSHPRKTAVINDSSSEEDSGYIVLLFCALALLSELCVHNTFRILDFVYCRGFN